MLCMGLIVEEVYSSFSYLFDFFFFLIRVLIIMLKRIPKQKFEKNKFLIKDMVFFPPFQPFAVGSGFGR